MKLIKPNLAHFGSVNNRYTPEVDESSSVASLEKTPLTSSSDIHRINQITYFIEQHDYVLDLFDKMDDAYMDPADYLVVIIYVDAHTNSLVESPEPQAYMSIVTIIDDVSSGQEIIEPIK